MEEDKLLITETYLSLINNCNIELFGRMKVHLDKLTGIFPLVQFILERLETVVFLTTNDRLWDAEIVERSAQETLMKLMFITSADKDEREIRLNEFWFELSEINSIKFSEQSKKNLNNLGDNEIFHLANSPNVLSKEEEAVLREKWNVKRRKQLEQKWSFTQIVNSLANDYRGRPVSLFTSLSHGYRIASHVTHGDETGISIIAERNGRTGQEKNIANMAHYCRLLSDVLTYCTAMAIEIMILLSLKPDFFQQNHAKINKIESIQHKYLEGLFNDPSYDKFRL